MLLLLQMMAAVRFTLIMLAYALFRSNHWWMIAVSKLITTYVLSQTRHGMHEMFIHIYLHSIRCFSSLRNEKRHCCYTIITTIHVALPIEDRVRNLTKSIMARVCILNVCGYSTLLRSVQ